MLDSALETDRQGLASAQGDIDCALLVTWQHPRTRRIEPVGSLSRRHDGSYQFYYVQGALTAVDFRPFLAFQALDEVYEASDLFSFFQQRVMDARRPDYVSYLATLDLTEPTGPMEILARSAGRRLGDTVQLFPYPRVTSDGETSCTFLVHGVRHVDGAAPAIEKMHVGDELLLQDDEANESNKRAMHVVSVSGQPLGWVPDFLIDYVRHVRAAGPTRVIVERANGDGTPMHLRLLAHLDGSVDAGYQPFSGEQFQPITHGLPRRADAMPARVTAR